MGRKLALRAMRPPAPTGQLVPTLPLRSLHDGKRRLQHHLTVRQRRDLLTYLCEIAVRALRDSGIVAMIGLVSGDDRTLAYGRSLGLVPIKEEEIGLNGALRTAG